MNDHHSECCVYAKRKKFLDYVVGALSFGTFLNDSNLSAIIFRTFYPFYLNWYPFW